MQLSAGVPQGIKLGPIRFRILINDAASNAQSEKWKYVDNLTFAENYIGIVKDICRMASNFFSDWASMG